MYFYSNDLSMNQGAVSIDAEATILQFLKVCKSLLDYRFEKLVVNARFLDTPIVDGITIRQHWNLNSKSDIARRLKSLKDNTITYNDNEPLSAEIKRFEDVTYNVNSSELLREAYQGKLPAVSFDTNVAFHVPFLNIVYHCIEEDKYENKNETITHFCLLNHLTVHNEYLNAKRIEFINRDAVWNASVNPFLLKEATKSFLDSIKFTQDTEGLDEGQRIAKYLGIGTKIAFLNGWVQDDEISAKNHSGNQIRRVFRSKGKKPMFLSIDIRHGEFELLDEDGEHKAVYSFFGEKIHKVVDKATHKLTVK